MAKLITIGSLIDRTVEHFRLHFKELIGISLWIVVAAMPFLFSGYLAPFGVDELTPKGEVVTYMIVNVLGVVTTTLASLWIGICLIFTIDARAQGKNPDHVVLGKRSWKFMLSFFVLSAVIAIGLSVASALFIVPGILVTMFNQLPGTAGTVLGAVGILLLFAGIIMAMYTLIRYSVELAFAQYHLLLDNEATAFSFKTLRRAVNASRASVKGAWWPIALRLFVPNAIISLIVVGFTMTTNLATTVMISFAAAALSPLAITLISVALTLSVFIINALVMPLYSLTTYYLYDSVSKR
ncbi:MAG: hypothetical protein AAB473_03460 [Patescibacteria group bacterium]